jgi:hypothetical protein
LLFLCWLVADGWAAAASLLHSGSRSDASSVYSVARLASSSRSRRLSHQPTNDDDNNNTIIYYLTINDGAACSYHASIDRVRMMMSSVNIIVDR